jgi:hypothetical protein
MWKDEKNYHFCDWIRDKWFDKLEAKMNLDCPDSYQLRGMKEEQEAQEDQLPLPQWWDDAPISAQVAWLVHGQFGEHDEFDRLKAELKGEI